MTPELAIQLWTQLYAVELTREDIEKAEDDPDFYVRIKNRACDAFEEVWNVWDSIKATADNTESKTPGIFASNPFER